MSSLSEPSLPAKSQSLPRWPGSIHPDRAERAYETERLKSYPWVEGLTTRNGHPRWGRISQCGAPVPLLRVDGMLSWELHFCRDRACYTCARSRSRKLGYDLRDAMDEREGAPLYFVTLTRPRTPGETVRQCRRAFQRAWERVRHTPEWRAAVVGGVRAMEVTWSEGHAHATNRSPGWHLHAHIVLELANDATSRVPCPACSGAGFRQGRLRCKSCSSATVLGDGTMPAGVAAVLEAWTAIVAGSIRAQCGVELDRTNVGQLAKYLTKMFELPAARARDVYEGMAGAHIVQGFGSWRAWKSWGDVEESPHGWYSAQMRLTDIERMGPHELVPFYSRGVSVEVARNDPAALGRKYTPQFIVCEIPVAMVLEALRKDDRPVWERVADKPRDHGARCKAARLNIERKQRQESPHHFRMGRDPPTWDY